MPKNKKSPLTSDPVKLYTFSKEEWLYLSEKQANITLINSLISRFVTTVVCQRLAIDPKIYNIKLTADGNGIEIEPLSPKLVVPGK